jgi:uncharacterized phage protein (TIGR01671 family)
MRTIKFRLWNNKTKKWIHGPHKNPSLDGVNLFGENVLFGNLLNDVSIEDLNDIVALEFTGLYDKNDREIFEGDILLCSFRTERRYVEVRFHNGAFLFENRMPMEFLQYNEVEVAGNICENAGMLFNQ